MSQISGEYISNYTGRQIDSVVEFIHTNIDTVRNLPTLVKTIESQTKNLNELYYERVPTIENLLKDSLTRDGGGKDTLSVDEIVLSKNAHINLGQREGCYPTNIFTSSIIQVEGQKDYIPLYANQWNESNILSMGFYCGASPRASWYYNTNEIASLTHDGVWTTAAGNDFAEYRISDEIEAGRVICENGDGTMSRSYKRLQPGAMVVSDTFGSSIGKSEERNTPVAVAGRVLAFPYEDWWTFEPGEAVCAGPNGTVSKMTRREVRKYPERIIGTVSELPIYETWGDIEINGRIWIKIK